MFKFIEAIVIFVMGILCGFIILNGYGNIKKISIMPVDYMEELYERNLR